MKKIYYEKVGRRYKPVYEYDQTLMDAFPKGSHLVMCYPGGSSRRYNIDPALAPMIAAGRYAEDAISKELVKASEIRPHKKPITDEQRKAWKNLAKAFGDERYYIEIPSAREITDAGVAAMSKEAEKLLKNESIKRAYDHFMLLCALSYEEKKD